MTTLLLLMMFAGHITTQKTAVGIVRCAYLDGHVYRLCEPVDMGTGQAREIGGVQYQGWFKDGEKAAFDQWIDAIAYYMPKPAAESQWQCRNSEAFSWQPCQTVAAFNFQERDAGGHIVRHRAPIAQFRKLHPCPATGKLRGACPGYVVDHKWPLCARGTDTADNMQWQAKRESLVKDREEWRICRELKAWSQQ